MNDIKKWERFNRVLSQAEKLDDSEKLILARYLLNEVD